MSEYSVTVSWNRTSPEFLKGKYSREHTWSFDGGASIPASSSPNVVPLPYSNPKCVDPEEAFVASISSCHMLTWLFLASRAGFDVESYLDRAKGVMTKGENGQSWVSSVVLNPVIEFTGEKRPTPEELDRLHHLAHEQCFIANSVKTTITVASGPRR